MTWLVLALLVIGQVLLWRRQRRLERENTQRTVALTRFLNAQLSLDESHAKTVAALPDMVQAEVRQVRKAIEKDYLWAHQADPDVVLDAIRDFRARGLNN